MPTARFERHRLAILLLAAAVAACGESPTDPGDDVNPALAEEASAAGFGGSGASSTLPQGAADFTGPGGMAMDATAEEFIQQLTLEDGTVLRTSGIGIYAVPASSEADPVFDRVTFGAALTGSLESVDLGSYDIGPWPPFDFIEEVFIAHAQVRETGLVEREAASDGVITLVSLEYLPDVYTCELKGTAIIADLCEYQIGLLEGRIEFVATLDDGTTIVQESTAFTVPIRRRTIIAHRE